MKYEAKFGGRVLDTGTMVLFALKKKKNKATMWKIL